jgi:hypothetical protein
MGHPRLESKSKSNSKSAIAWKHGHPPSGCVGAAPNFNDRSKAWLRVRHPAVLAEAESSGCEIFFGLGVGGWKSAPALRIPQGRQEYRRYLVRGDEAEAGGEGADVPAGEGAEVRRVDIIYDGDGVVVFCDVVAGNADGPDAFAEVEFFFDAEI